MLTLLVSCGGGSGGRSDIPAPGPSSPGTTPPPDTPVVPPDSNSPPVAYADALDLQVTISLVDINATGHPVVHFFVADDSNAPINDVSAGNVRFIIAKLQSSELGNLHGIWQSYINTIEMPGIGPGSEPRLQATTESGSAGTLVNNTDGSYRYTFEQAITSLSDFDENIVAQARTEGLDLSFDEDLTHRVSIQFSGGPVPANPSYDFQPSTGATSEILRSLIVATDSCNNCHENLAVHGGGRTEVDYCVTCHNPGSTDANSSNSVAFDEMIHRLHYGANLPSVIAGGSYQIYGFRNSLHDYSNVHYPRDHWECVDCHAGSATSGAIAELTSNGDNWNEYPTRRACGACHDDINFDEHYGGQSDDTACRSCHSQGGLSGSIAESHLHRESQAAQAYRFDILNISNTSAGEKPVIDLQIVDPTNDNQAYDIVNDAPFTQGGGASRIAATVAWSTSDYTNTGNEAIGASSVSVDVLSGAENIGNNVFRVKSPIAIPDGSGSPFVAASGSGAVTIEGHPAETLDGVLTQIPVKNALANFSINETDGIPGARRSIVAIEQCLNCHDSLSLHGNNRTDNLEGCATCHNPRNTDRSVRAAAFNPPTDGKQEESLDFKTMIHGIHAAGFRENPLQIVGFRGFSTYVYDEHVVQYPAPLQNCLSCHVGTSYGLPLADSVLAVTTDSGADMINPGDDKVASPAAAVCASCHDSDESITHIERHGGDFSTTQDFIDTGITVERCSNCHGPGKFSEVGTAHGLASP